MLIVIGVRGTLVTLESYPDLLQHQLVYVVYLKKQNKNYRFYIKIIFY